MEHTLKKGIVWLLGLAFALTLGACDEEYKSPVIPENFTISALSVDITDNVLPLLLGRDTTLQVAIGPDNATNKEVVWSSDDPTIASVSSAGVISALKVGSTQITVKPLVGSATKATQIFTLTVVDQLVPVSSIAIAVDSELGEPEVYVGETLKLKATVNPANATYYKMKWSSSDPTIATVEASTSKNAVVTALKNGTVVITAAATDGSGVTKTISIDVIKSVPAETVTLTAHAYELAIDEIFDIKFSYTPANATRTSIVWESSDEDIMSVKDGVVTVYKEGEVTITATAPGPEEMDDPDVQTMTLKAAVGKYNDTFIPGRASMWQCVTANSTYVVQAADSTMLVTMAASGTNWRGDFKRVPGKTFTFDVSAFPFVALKTNLNRMTGGNKTVDTSYGTWKNTNNNLNSSDQHIATKDGNVVYFADLSLGLRDKPAADLVTNPLISFATNQTFQYKLADFPQGTNPAASGLNTYKVYWFRSFKTKAELDAFLAAE